MTKEMKIKSIVLHKDKLNLISDFSDDGEFAFIDMFYWQDINSKMKYCKLVPVKELKLIKS